MPVMEKLVIMSVALRSSGCTENCCVPGISRGVNVPPVALSDEFQARRSATVTPYKRAMSSQSRPLTLVNVTEYHRLTAYDALNLARGLVGGKVNVLEN